MKISPVGAEFYVRTDGEADMTKLATAFLNFVNAPKSTTKLSRTSATRNKTVH